MAAETVGEMVDLKVDKLDSQWVDEMVVRRVVEWVGRKELWKVD